MAIKATGMIKVGGLTYYKDPELTLVPRMPYRGKLVLDVNVFVEKDGSKIQVNAFPYQEINATTLTYPTPAIDPYTDLVKALEAYVVADLSQTNPEATFTTF
jgi:hypothetical protein